MLNVSTKDILHHIDNELFRCLGRTADALSCPCYIVGEFVRDIFLGHEGKHVEEREVEAIAHWQCPGVEHMTVESVYRKDCDHPQPNSLAVGHTYGQPFEVSCLA